VWPRLRAARSHRLLELPVREPGPAEGTYGKALLLGCLIGISLSWQVVLTDGAREHIYRRIAAVAAATRLLASPDWSVRARAVQRVEDPRPTVPWAGLTTTGSPAATRTAVRIVGGPRSPAAFRDRAEPLPRRLTLADVAPLQEEAAERPPASAAVPDLQVAFAVNSSFLSPSAIAGLRRWVERLPDKGPYVVNLAATVSDDGVKEADAEAARRYNRWLAERRIARVGDWLRQHSGVKLAVRDSYLPRDASRRVTVSLREANESVAAR
jgi:hypothetical protein